ncbi:MAG: 16S rRNA (guanine(966)-N(2))-methyltransferase RsmD [Phycisphaerales bacterium]
MRIIAGEYRSRKLISPEGMTTRPIPDRVKESVFGMLGARIEGAAVLDAFAGSGSIGLEALSRGAASCVFVEQDKRSCETLERNIEVLKCGDRCTVVRGDALGLSVVARCPRPLDFAFFDPPYPLIEQKLGWERVKGQLGQIAKILAHDGFVLVRTPRPFAVELPSETRPVEPEHGKKFKKGRKGRDERDGGGRGGREMKEWRGVRIQDEPSNLAKFAHEKGQDADEEGEAEVVVGSEGEAAPAVAALREPGDMHIAGAKGPESHPYGSTEVHWYMGAGKDEG